MKNKIFKEYDLKRLGIEYLNEALGKKVREYEEIGIEISGLEKEIKAPPISEISEYFQKAEEIANEFLLGDMGRYLMKTVNALIMDKIRNGGMDEDINMISYKRSDGQISDDRIIDELRRKEDTRIKMNKILRMRSLK